MANRMNNRERSWVLYDVGNSAFVMLSSTVAPIYFGSLITGSVVVGWGYAETIASLIVALLMPFLGSLADFQGNKKKFFIGAAGTGIIACSALSIPLGAIPFLVLYIIAAVGVNSSMVFYDAFLIDATEPHNYDSLSSKGYAWGYIGSLVPFLLCVALIFGGEAIGLDKASATRISFLITAVWWAVFTIPMIKNVKQLHFKPHAQHSLIQAFSGLAKTMRSIIGNRTLLLFMLAFFCYIDGVHTIIKMATSYGTELGIDSTQLIMALVATQVVAFPAALAFGKLASKLSARTMLIVSVAAYALITLYAAFFLKGATEFWILAISVGLFQGGIQALSRSYFGKLIPKDHCNEYFGFFDIFGKYASIIGTFLVSSITHITGNASLGILSITVLFVLGLVFLFLMPKAVE
ncbi:MAG: MFS transporter [Coriobacteriaceae bacterium]|nr:MFS transporter [Coriobacteriaceae bacterium]